MPGFGRFTARNMMHLSASQLRRAADVKDQIESLETELSRLLGTAGRPVAPRARRKLSAAARARIAAAQRARWAKQSGAKPKRKVSAAARKRLAESAKARWAKAKAAGKKTL